jgi:hypothetical protein
MKENRNHLMTFLMLSLLILVSSMKNKLKFSHILMDKTNFDHKNDEYNNTDSKKINYDSFDKNDHSGDIQLPENSISREETKKKKEDMIDKYNLLKSQQKFLNNTTNFSFGKNSTDHNAIESVASSFPFVVSLNLIQTSSNNTVDQPNNATESLKIPQTSDSENSTQSKSNMENINSSSSTKDLAEGKFNN